MAGTGDGVKTRRLILDAASDVLRAHGAAGFSVPKVATAVGVQQGTITHYFPTRRDLLVALARDVAEHYGRLVTERVQDLDATKDGWAATFLGWLFDDAVTPPTSELFPELWSLARTDPDFAAAVRGIYLSAVDHVLRALGHAPEDPAARDLADVLWVVGVTTEGMTAVHGSCDLTDRHFQAARRGALALLAPRLVAAQQSVRTARS
jgi:AcrR family transcriptional regulator